MSYLKQYFYILSLASSLYILAGCGATTPYEEPSEIMEKSPKNTEQINLIQKSDLQLVEIENKAQMTRTSISGRVVPKNTTQLFAEVPGQLQATQRVFKAGSNFKKGETLVRIDSREFQLNLEAQRASFLNVLTGVLPDLKSDYPDSYQQWFDYVNIYNFGESLAELPEPKSVEEKFLLTTNQVYSLYFQIKALEDRLRKYRIRAPYTGTVTTANIDVGSTVAPGQPLGTISNRVQYELEAGIPIEVANQMKIGSKLTFTSNKIAGEWIGSVVRINNLVDVSTQNIPVFFSLQGKNIRAGMYLEAELKTEGTQQASLIPSTALGRDESVLLLQQDVIVRKPIEIIDFKKDSVLVLGLGDTDMIILNQFDLPVEGIKVGS